jgi:hypothetical protein
VAKRDFTRPDMLSKAELVDLVSLIQHDLYFEEISSEGQFWNPRKELGPATLKEIKTAFDVYGLAPDRKYRV